MQPSNPPTPTSDTPDVPGGIRLSSSWIELIGDQFEQPYMKALRLFLKERLQGGAKIFPSGSKIFAALDALPVDHVKVVILGQDPYHGPGQAHGLCFSVNDGVPFPPSLENILKELQADMGLKRPQSGNLTPWTRQGVLLLNSTLTVEQGQAGSHQGKGWETFTDELIHRLAEREKHLVFVLWGAYAQKKGAMIDRDRHLVLEAPHPSPLSAHRGFFGSKPFSKANEYLLNHRKAPIDWTLP